MKTNYDDEEVVYAIQTALKETGYSIRKITGLEGYFVFNDVLNEFKMCGGEAQYVATPAELIDAIGDVIGRYGDNEVLEPLRAEQLMDNTFITLEESGYPEDAIAHIAQDWAHSSDNDEYDFYVAHKQALVLFDLIVNGNEHLNDPAILTQIYEETIPHIMHYKMDSEAATEAGELSAIIREKGYQLVPNGDAFSFREIDSGNIDPTLYYGVYSALCELNVERELVEKLKTGLGLGADDHLDSVDAVKRVEALAETNPPLFDKLVSTAARLDTVNRYCGVAKIAQLAVFEDLPKEPKINVKLGGNSDYCGIKGVEFIYRNEWTDPELRYKGKNYSVVDVEDAFFHNYEDEVSAGKFDGDFSAYLFDHADEVRALLDELNPLEKPTDKKRIAVERD